MKTKLACVGLLLWMCAMPARAQDEATSLDRIEVTGSRISYRDLLDTPAVSITRPGDYLLQEFRLENDTRDEAARERELHETIARLLAKGGTRYRLLHGDAYRVVLDRGNYRVDVSPDDKRPDTSAVTLQLRADLGADPQQAESIALAMQQFLRETEGAGRTEVQVVGEAALGMARPERFRYDLISAISRDTGQVVQALGLQCSVELGGLNSRIEWQRVSAGELLLYIPYTMTIDACVGQKP